MKKLVALLLAFALCATMASFAMADEVEIVYTGEANKPIVSSPITLKILSATSNNVYDWDSMRYFREALEGTNITIEAELYHWSNYADVMTTRLAAGVDMPDIVFVDGNDADGAFYNAGLFVPMNEYAEEWGFNQKKFLEQYPTMKGAITTATGDQIFLPYVTDDSDLGRCLMIHYKLFEDNGIQIPTTTDELYDALKVLKELGDWNGNGLADETPFLFCNDIYMLYQLGCAWGLNLETGWHVNDEGIVSCDWIDPAYKDFVVYLNKLASEGLMNDDFATVTSDQQLAGFAADIIGATISWGGCSAWFSDLLEPGIDLLSVGGRGGYMNIDALEGPTGEKCFYSRDVFQRAFAITRDCKYPEVAYCLLDYMLNDDIVRTVWIGKENGDWSYDADGNMVFTEQYILNEDNYQWNNGANAEVLPGLQKTFYRAETPEAYTDLQKTVGDHTKRPIGFAFVAPEYTEKLNTYKADFDTYVQESFNAFVKGTRDVEAEWDSYVEYCKALGADELTSVYQARVDASK